MRKSNIYLVPTLQSQTVSSVEIAGRVIKVREAGAEVTMLQTKAGEYMRMALYQTEPELGVKAVDLLPTILKDKDVGRELGLPEFDRIIVRPRRHHSREADLTLLRDGEVVARFSVKFSPTGNIRYCIDSWRAERADADLLALVPVRGVRSDTESDDFVEALKRGESIYYITITRIPSTMRRYPTRELLGLFDRLLGVKREAEGLRYVWRVNIREVARALRDYEMLRRQDEMLELQRETLRRQDEMLELQRETLGVLRDMKGLLERFLGAVVGLGEKRRGEDCV
mgnify:CR=1 FL=1